MEKQNDKIVDGETQIQFDDVEGYGAVVSGIKGIIMAQYQRCCFEGSKEMIIGGVRKTMINGQLIEMPAPNQIEIFINSVEMLRVLLEAYIYKEKKFMEKRMNNFDKQLEAIQDQQGTELKKLFGMAHPKSEKWLGKYGKGYNERVFNINKSHQDKKVAAYKNLLVSLSFLMNKLNYFDETKGRA